MKKIEKFDKQNLKELRVELNAVLTAFAEKNGLQAVPIGNIRFDSNSFGTKLEIKIKPVQGFHKVIQTPIPTGDIKIGDKFFQGRTQYEVTATDNKGMFKYSVKTQNGKIYKIKPTHLLNMEKI